MTPSNLPDTIQSPQTKPLKYPFQDGETVKVMDLDKTGETHNQEKCNDCLCCKGTCDCEYSCSHVHTINEDDARAKDFLSCLGNGQSIFEIEGREE